MTKSLEPNKYPDHGNLMSDKWNFSPIGSWTDSFYTGVLWHLFKYTKNMFWKNLAIENTHKLYKDRLVTYTHDIGFMMMCSYGDGLEITNNHSYIDAIVTGAHSLSKRYNCK